MKCVSCGEDTGSNRIVCSKCRSVDNCMDYIRVHKCGSFAPVKGASERVCQNVLRCRPIKDALKKEPLIERNLGHVICPEAYVNLRYVVHNEFDEEALRSNYRECLES